MAKPAKHDNGVPNPIPSCQLLDLVIDMNWDKVIQHAKDYPDDARYQDGDDWETPLFLACQYDAPLTVIEALINAFPGAVETRSKRRDIPLHMACKYEVSPRILECLLRHHPRTVTCENRWGKTPLFSLVESNKRPLRWNKVEILLSAVAREQNLYSSADPSTRDPLLVHAAVSIGSRGCPHQLLEMAIHHRPEQVQMYDLQGRLPLHIAVRRTEWSLVLRRRYKPREKLAIETLLRHHKKSAEIPWKGQYPLHMAVANGHTWENGVKTLFQCFPEAVQLMDPVTKLLPFQLSSVPVGEAQPSTDTIYNLLLEQPNVLMSYTDLPPQKQKQSQKKMHSRQAMQLHRSKVTAACCAVIAAAAFAATLYN